MADKRIEGLKSLEQELTLEKKNYEPGWQDLSKYFRPLKTDITSDKTPGDKKDFFVSSNAVVAFGSIVYNIVAGVVHSHKTLITSRTHGSHSVFTPQTFAKGNATPLVLSSSDKYLHKFLKEPKWH